MPTIAVIELNKKIYSYFAPIRHYTCCFHRIRLRDVGQTQENGKDREGKPEERQWACFQPCSSWCLRVLVSYVWCRTVLATQFQDVEASISLLPLFTHTPDLYVPAHSICTGFSNSHLPFSQYSPLYASLAHQDITYPTTPWQSQAPAPG